MKKWIGIIMVGLLATVGYAATTSTNGYFYLPDVGDSGTAIHTAWVAVNEATDTVIKGLVDAVALNTAKTTNATHTGDVTGATALTIASDKILESMLKAVDAAADEECLTYETTTGDFEWQACGGAGSGDVTDVGNCTGGACLDGTSDGGTNILFYDAQGATTLSVGDNAGAVALTLPNSTGTIALTTSNVSSATLASTVTITDNESTAENNPIVFVAGGDLDGGNLGLESDGTTYYTPSTGVITATGFVGALTGNVTGTATATSDTTWTNHNSYPAACSAGQFVGTIGDTNTCAQPADVTGNAATASALAADPANCASSGLAGGINASGVAEGCITPNAGTNIANDLEEEVTEGSLADSTIVSADIKDGTIASGDLAVGTITPSICFIIDGGGSAIETGAKAWVRATTSFTIGGMDITADQSGSIVVDLWKDSYANFPPTDADTITASAPPTLSTEQKAQDTTLTDWTTTVTAGDYIRANVDSATTVTMVEVCIYE